MIKYFQIIIPAMVSVFGFFVTYKLMKKEFLHSVKKSLNEDRKKVYEEIYGIMDKVINNRYIIYDAEYIDLLEKMKPRAYIFSSKGVKEKYRDFCIMVYDEYSKYEQAFEEDNGTNPLMIGARDVYKDDHLLDHANNKMLLAEILDQMRQDLAIEN